MNIRVIQNGEEEEKKESSSSCAVFPSCLQLLLEKHGEINYADGEMWNSFYNFRQMNAMVCRAIHRFYRMHAVECLPINRVLLGDVREIVDRRYIDKSWYAEKLDLTIAWADAEFNTQECNDMADRVVKVGEALEGAGRFLDAALVSKFVAELLKKITNSTQRNNASMSFGFCGLAYRRANDVSNAERYYVRSLHLHPNVLDYDNDNHLKVNIFNLLNLYQCGARADGDPSELRNVRIALTVLTGLLYVVGYQTPPNPLAPVDHQPPSSAPPPNPIAEVGKHALELLNPSVHKIKFAKKALQESARAGTDVEQWRKKLFSFVRKGHGNGPVKCFQASTTLHGKNTADIIPPTTASRRKQDKMTARGAMLAFNDAHATQYCTAKESARLRSGKKNTNTPVHCEKRRMNQWQSMWAMQSGQLLERN